jgi:hypothetical protein
MGYFTDEQVQGLLRDIEKMVRNDLINCIRVRANIPVAQQLCILTEFLGGLSRGTFGRGEGNPNYQAGIAMLGDRYKRVLGTLSKYHGRGFLYSFLRVPLIHSYIFAKRIEDIPWIIQVENDPDNPLSKPRSCGLELQDDGILLDTNTYSVDLLEGMKRLFEKIRAGDRTARKNLEDAVMSLRD